MENDAQCAPDPCTNQVKTFLVQSLIAAHDKGTLRTTGRLCASDAGLMYRFGARVYLRSNAGWDAHGYPMRTRAPAKLVPRKTTRSFCPICAVRDALYRCALKAPKGRIGTNREREMARSRPQVPGRAPAGWRSCACLLRCGRTTS